VEKEGQNSRDKEEIVIENSNKSFVVSS